MYWTLAIRHLLVRPGRSLVLLVGYALGVAVMIVLLSIGDAMLDQSRDASLIGGGELTALPEGIDIEAMRTGGLAGMFFGINGARFVSRQMLDGPRQSNLVSAVSPVLEQKLLAVRVGKRSWTVRAGGDLPESARAAGAALLLTAGRWADNRDDSTWRAPGAQSFFNEIDHFHLPIAPDSTWAEWHYFNVTVGNGEWWYLTLLVGGDVRGSDWGGQVLVTHRSPGGTYRRYAAGVARNDVSFDTTRADLIVGGSSVTLRDGVYHVRGRAGGATFDLLLTPAPDRYFPPVELGAESSASGYVVPALVASATGTLCADGSCRRVRNAPAYHDHNWGNWRAVTWEWGAGRGSTLALLYGGVLGADRSGASVPFLLALEDSLGLRQVYRFSAIERFGAQPVSDMPGIEAPDSLRITATRLGDTLSVVVRIRDVTASRSRAAGPGRVFLQMHGKWRVAGKAAGEVVTDTGSGFFETWARQRPR